MGGTLITTLVQPRKTRPYITERLLMGRKKSNKQNEIYKEKFWIDNRKKELLVIS